MSSEWTGRMHATPKRVPPEEQVLCGTKEWSQVRPTALCRGAGFSASPSIMMKTGIIVGSTQTIIHPIVQMKQPQLQHTDKAMGGGWRDHNDDNDGGAGGGGGAPVYSKVPPENYYCPSNPCINRKIHELHLDMLAGKPDAEMQMNRYLLLCAVLLRSSSINESGDCNQKEGEMTPKAVEAAISWKCDLCSNTCCPASQKCKNVRMLNGTYRLQFRSWKLPGFCVAASSSSSASSHPDDKQQMQHGQKTKKRNNLKTDDFTKGNSKRRTVDLELPLVQCLQTCLEDTPCYHALPDLGMYIRGILQRRYYTEAIRKHWVKAHASSSSSLSLSQSSHAQQQQQHAPQGRSTASASDHQQQTHQDTRTKAQWKYMHGVCANLLLESIPCMKRTKRCCNSSYSSSSSSSCFPSGVADCQINHGNDTVEVMACINVMHGTLLKLYPLGAKTPTFNARVHLFSR